MRIFSSIVLLFSFPYRAYCGNLPDGFELKVAPAHKLKFIGYFSFSSRRIKSKISSEINLFLFFGGWYLLDQSLLFIVASFDEAEY